VARRTFGREVRFTAWICAQSWTGYRTRRSRPFLRGIADQPSLQRVIADYGDTQYQSRLLVPVLLSAVRAGIRAREFGRAVARTVRVLAGALVELVGLSG
jgi:hypothetical protein